MPTPVRELSFGEASPVCFLRKGEGVGHTAGNSREVLVSLQERSVCIEALRLCPAAEPLPCARADAHVRLCVKTGTPGRLPGGPVVKTSPSGSIPGWGAVIPHASWPR